MYVVGTVVVSVQVLRLGVVHGIVEVSVQVERLDIIIVQGMVVQDTVAFGIVYEIVSVSTTSVVVVPVTITIGRQLCGRWTSASTYLFHSCNRYSPTPS